MPTARTWRLLARRLLRHPRWVVEDLIASRRPNDPAAGAWDWSPFALSLVEVCSRLGLELKESAVQTNSDAPGVPKWDGSTELGQVLWSLVQGMRPERVIEVGVARGYSSAVMLSAMNANQSGHLWSIDLPAPSVDERTTGSLVPDALRDRWTLSLGLSSVLIPRLVVRHGPFDLIVHDGDHNPATQRREWAALWRALRPGGVLVMDDFSHDAYQEARQSTAAPVWIVAQTGQSGKPKRLPMGIVQSPS